MREIFTFFIKLGALGFGGPLALIAQMQHELVEEKKWISIEKFRQVFALVKAMPGPVAFQMAVYLGRHRAGFWGGALAGFCVVFPSFLMIILIAEVYTKMNEILWIHSALLGMQLAAFALIVIGSKSLAQGFFRKSEFWLLFIFSFVVLRFAHVPEPLVILLCGLSVFALVKVRDRVSLRAVPLLEIFLICIQAGAFVFGTGLAIVPLLEADFVQRLQWLTHKEFMDALAFGQMTPGPVVITVSFIGYKFLGLSGAVVGTIGIFLPAFIHMVTWFPRSVEWLSKQTWISTFTVGVTAAVLGGIFHSLLNMGADFNMQQIFIVAALGIFMYFVRWPSWAFILNGALLGILLF